MSRAAGASRTAAAVLLVCGLLTAGPVQEPPDPRPAPATQPVGGARQGGGATAEPAPAGEAGSDPRSFRLANGCELWLEPVPGCESMGLFLFVRSGWTADPLDRTGRAHLVEHMVMTGATPSRPEGWRYEEWVRRRPQGANAMTRDAWTLYFSIGSRDECSEDARWFAEVLAGSLRIDVAQLGREKGRVGQEIRNMTGFLPGGVLQWRARRLLLPDARGRTGIGVEAQVDAVTLDEVRATVRATHHVGNVLVVAVGRVHPERDLPFWNQLLGGLEPRATLAPVPDPSPELPPASAPHPNVGAVFGSLAFQAPAPDDPDLPAFLVAASLVLQRAQIDRKPRGAQTQGVFFPATYAFLEGPELLLLNLRGEDDQGAELVEKDLRDWLRGLASKRLSAPLLLLPRQTLRWTWVPLELGRSERRAFTAQPRDLYRLGLSRGLRRLRGLPDDLDARLAAVGPTDVQAVLRRWFADDRGRFLSLVPGRPDKDR